MTSAWDLDSSLRAAVAALATEPGAEATAPDAEEPAEDTGEPSGDQLREWYDAMLTSRQLDLAGYWLRSWNEGYHAISSAGHEAAAGVAAALRPTDPALLSPRSGGFYCGRAAQVPASDAVLDVLGAVAGVATEPMAGGRHTPYGSRALTVVPTSGGGAAHLPRAMGLAFALDRSRRLGVAGALDVPADSVVVCAFAGEDVNRATATAALNAAGWCGYAGLPMPLLLVCQDDTDTGWVAEVLRAAPELAYVAADGCELPDTYRAASEAAEYVRKRRRPAVLHLDVVRLMDHGAGPEVARDPLLLAARRLVRAGVATPDELVNRYDELGWKVRRAAEQMVAEPRLGSAQEVLAPLSPRRPLRVAQTAAVAAEPDARTRGFGDALPETEGPLTVAQAINRTLGDALAAYPHMVVFGPEVTQAGSHGVTEGLRERYGAARVFDTFPDETAVIGLGLGAGLAGLLPVAEVSRLAQLHNGAAQLRDEGASTQFFSQGGYRNPLVIRVAGFAAPDGYGGHAYNENAIAGLREIPGLVIAAPARPDDAAELLRTCLAAAATDGTCCVYVEPLPLYHTRDLHTDGDGGWLAPYPAPEQWVSGHVPLGRARVYGDGGELTIVTYGDALRTSLRVSSKLTEEGLGCRVVDLRWLAPLPLEDVVREAGATGQVLVVDPARRSGGVADALVAGLVGAGFTGRIATVASADTYVPLGPAAAQVLVTESVVEQAARTLVAVPPGR